MGIVEALSRHPIMRAKDIDLKEKIPKEGSSSRPMAPERAKGVSKTSILIDIPLLSMSAYW